MTIDTSTWQDKTCKTYYNIIDWEVIINKIDYKMSFEEFEKEYTWWGFWDVYEDYEKYINS